MGIMTPREMEDELKALEARERQRSLTRYFQEVQTPNGPVLRFHRPTPFRFAKVATE